MTKMKYWDNSNIAENYPGKTLPLTYSFICEGYAQVYTNFCRLLTIPSSSLKKNQKVFDHMLGFIEYQIYYNIANWYELLKILPLFNMTRVWFDTMLEPVQKSRKIESNIPIHKKVQDLRVILMFFFNWLFFSFLHKSFQDKTKNLFLIFEKYELKKADLLQIATDFKQMRKQFFEVWAITIVNDFRVMISFGIFNQLVQKYCSNAAEILSNLKTRGRPLASAEVLNNINQIINLINDDKKARLLFQTKNTSEILDFIQHHKTHVVSNSILNYLDEFGHRLHNELKLEQPKLKDEPEQLILLIQKYIKNESRTINKISSFPTIQLKKSVLPLTSVCIEFVRKQVIHSIAQREYYRLQRGKAFQLARSVYLEIGRRLEKEKKIEKLNDIFYLYHDEVMAICGTHYYVIDLKEIISIRKKSFEKSKKNLLPQSIVTDEFGHVIDQKKITSDALTGKTTSLGEVSGEVMVMNELDINKSIEGKILVTRATDPGWTIIFPLLKGVITEYGGMLSHASIVARELGIPCVTSVKNVTTTLKSGQKITLKAESNAGTIKIH